MIRLLVLVSTLLLFGRTAYSGQQIQPWLGVEIDPAPQPAGIRVKRVIPGAPAEKAGFQEGDILRSIDKVPIKTRDGLLETLRDRGVGTTVKVYFTRAKKDEVKDLKLEIIPDMLDLAKANLVHKPALPFELQNVATNKKLVNADLKGKAYILEFWATWCPACRAAAPLVNRWSKAHPQIPVIGISDEAPQTILAFAKREAIDYAQTYDEGAKAQNAYGMGSIPAFILVDKKVEVADLTVGGGVYLEALLKKAEDLP
jgi:thiol-disulfide isomerase/thioredoxin